MIEQDWFIFEIIRLDLSSRRFSIVTMCHDIDDKYEVVSLNPLLGRFRFGYEYDYEIRHFWRQLLASSPADVMKS